MSNSLLQLRCLDKSFPGVHALKAVDLDVKCGEVLGLVGENGAGKSTLIRILSGVYRADSGEIRWLGQSVCFDSPRDAIEAGIATIHQELADFPRLTVAENLLLGERWPRRRFGGVDWRALHEEATRRLRQFEIDVPSVGLFAKLTAAERQEVAMARTLSQQSRLLILDEPTASFSEQEVEHLFERLGRLREAGVAILYISHRLDEILRLTDRIAVLRDGELVSVYPTSDVTGPRLVRDMVGRTVESGSARREDRPVGEPVLELDRVTRANVFESVSLAVRAGEVVGLAGLVGAGRSELARAVYGLYPLDSGEIRLRGSAWQPSGAHEALAAGLVYLPEERKSQSLVLEHGLGESIRIGFSDLLARFGIVPRRAARRRVAGAIDEYRIRATGVEQAVGTLSGGNQQKIVLARWLERGPEVLLLDEPTRGIDVGAKAEIHALIDRLAESGKAILLISSDLPELLALSDRVFVLRSGRIVSEFDRESMSQEAVLMAAAGIATSAEDPGDES